MKGRAGRKLCAWFSAALIAASLVGISAEVSAPPAGADGCPVPVSGHETGTATSTFFGGAVFPTDADVVYDEDGTLSGTVSINGGAPSALVGVVDCADIEFGTVGSSISFTGELSSDGRSASGSYTNGPDFGTWETTTDPYELTASSTVEPPTVAPSGATSWTITVTNNGTAAATQVEAEFDISGAGQFGSLGLSSVSQGTGCSLDSELSTIRHCDLGTILAGGEATATMPVVSTGGAGTSIVVSGYAFGVHTDPECCTDATAEPVTIDVVASPYVLTATSTVQPTSIAPLGASSWFITVGNTGSGAATQVDARFDISGSGAFGDLDQSSVSQGTGCTLTSATRVDCDLGTILPGQQATANVTVSSTGGAGSSIVASGSASAVNAGADATADPVTIQVVAPASLPPGEASGTAHPGVVFQTAAGGATATTPVVVRLKLPKKVASGTVNPFALMALAAAPKVTSVTPPSVSMSISSDSTERSSFCNEATDPGPCAGDVVHLTAFSGYTDKKKPAKVTIIWDKTQAGSRGANSKVYKRADAPGSPRKVLPACVKVPKVGYGNLPCVFKRKQAKSGDVTIILLLLSGDPKFARK